MSQLFASGGRSIGTSASASVLPVNIQGLLEGLMKASFERPTGYLLQLGPEMQVPRS